LRLEEGVDVLEAGVEVMARPPGKRITSLSLLSGGEKALTAISVLFALFRTRPSPFCLLDEVDAALDEANTRRFVRILKEFASESQFVIITHSKATIAEAETLYGITMEEEGVSRKLAVRMEDAERFQNSRPPAAGAGSHRTRQRSGETAGSLPVSKLGHLGSEEA
ncbi:MAG: AAA family ATPase, partial [Planctomycetota bacterium]